MLVTKKPRLTVVTLHRVGHLSKLTIEHIEQHFRFLSRHFRLVLPSDLTNTRGLRRVAMVTIDDGHADAYRTIFPIAEAMGVPISLCVPTDFFFRQEWLWFDKFGWAMRHAPVGTTVDVDGVTLRAGDTEAFERLKLKLKRYAPQRRDEVMEEMLSRLEVVPPPVPPDEDRSVTADEMQEMLRSGLVELVGHTATHTIATVLSRSDFRRELKDSKRELEDFSGRRITAFCYPNGHLDDFGPETTEAVQDAGFQMAFTSVEGTNALSQKDLFTLKRVHAHPRQAVFEKCCTGLVDIQGRLMRRSETTQSHH